MYQRVQTISRVTEMLFDLFRDYPFSLYRMFCFLVDLNPYDLNLTYHPSLSENELKGIAGFSENFTCQVKRVYRIWENLIDAMNCVNTILVLCKEECLVKQMFRIAISYLISTLVEEITIAAAEMKTTKTRIEEWHNNILAIEQLSPIFDDWNGKLDWDNKVRRSQSLFDCIMDEYCKWYPIKTIEQDKKIEREVTWLCQSSTLKDVFREDFYFSRAKIMSMAEKRDHFALISLPTIWLLQESHTFYNKIDRFVWLDIMNRVESMKVRIRKIMEKMYINEKNENRKKAVEIL
jgi:hypothetical protein